jgi:2-amino-4-hydroxy-6-hydroxymethyldihydropteridine diphosphokinase
MATIYLALGSNLGNRAENLRMALRGLTRMARVDAVSSLYRSAPQGPPQPDYYNAVCRVETGLDPEPLLRFLQALEYEIGRRPGGERHGARPIDIDILLYDDLAIDSEALSVPHPRMLERAFVMRPLAEIAPETGLPGSGKTAGQVSAAMEAGGLSVVAERGWDGVLDAAQDVRL